MIEGIKILHLTDIHIGFGDFPYDSVKDMAIRIGDIFEDVNKEVNLVLITGDIFNGKANFKTEKNQIIEDGCTFFDTLLNRLKTNSNPALDKADFLFLPGNHDIDRNVSVEEDRFNIYRSFLETFYGSKKNAYSLYNEKYLYRIKIFDENKIIILGLNSCKFEKYKPQAEEFKWIDKIDFSTIHRLENREQDDLRNIIRNYQEKVLGEKYYDYGFIQTEQYIAAIDELKSKIGIMDNYTTVAAFHHHFYPFPEVYGKTGDGSLMKNFEYITQRLPKINTRVILHGHKHLPMIRPIINDTYLENPDALMYAISGGNIGNATQWDRYFQLVEVFNHKSSSRVARILKFNFKGDKLEPTQEIILPPIPNDEMATEIKLKEILKREREYLYKLYQDKVYDLDSTSRNLKIDRTIENLGNILTSFSEVKADFNRFPEEALLVMLFAHYKTISMEASINDSFDSIDIRDDIRNIVLTSNHEDKEFIKLLFDFLEIIDERDKKVYYEKINSINATTKIKRMKSLAVIADLFTELYLVLSTYADYYYEQFSHNVNIKMDKNLFHKHIPDHYIQFKSLTERRTVSVKLKSKDPTCHKIAVMFIKLFENRLGQYGKDFDEISLKVFYIRPDIEKDNSYELEDYNFEAYIPNLLPLLIGENLYKQKEVFIRELIQNSIDAILLRKELLGENNEDIPFYDSVNIHFGKGSLLDIQENGQREALSYIKVEDNGVGMTPSQVERYFIHIARSYYNSNEYNELAEKQKIKYRPISKFGIGFLSSFLFAREIKIQTLSYLPDTEGVDINIPNHEGCFFSKKDSSIKNVGTSIILFKNDKLDNNIKDILTYMFRTMLDIQLDINISGEDENGNKIEKKIKAFSLRRELRQKASPVFFVPLNDKGIVYRDYNENELFLNEPFGISFTISSKLNSWEQFRGQYLEMNGGILLNDGSSHLNNVRFNNCFVDVFINYPPSYIELDVSREKIVNFQRFDEKNRILSSNEMRVEIMAVLTNQVIQWVEIVKTEKQSISVLNIYRLIYFLKLNNTKNIELLTNEFYYLRIKLNKRSISFDFVNKDSVGTEKNTNVIYITSPFEVIKNLTDNIDIIIKLFCESILPQKRTVPKSEVKNLKKFERIKKRISLLDELSKILKSKPEILNKIIYEKPERSLQSINQRYIELFERFIEEYRTRGSYEEFTERVLDNALFLKISPLKNKLSQKIVRLINEVLSELFILFAININLCVINYSVNDIENNNNNGRNISMDKFIKSYLEL